MRVIEIAITVLLAVGLGDLATRAAAAQNLAVSTPAAADPTEAVVVPGPLRPLIAPAPDPTPTPRRPGSARRDPAAPVAPIARPPAAAVRAWTGALAPTARGELARGRIVLDVAAHQVRIDDFAVTDAPGLEVALVAGDAVATTAAVLAAKRVSLGRLRRIKATVILRFPAELDPAVYRTLVVWSRRDRAPRGVARLMPGRAG